MNVDLMHGPIFKSLVVFMLPIFVSNLFQQLYNTVDTMIVGNVLGDTALAVDGKLDATKLDAAARIDIAKAEILDHRNAVARRLLKAFPNMRPAEHEALEQLKSWVEEKNAALRAQAEKVTGKKK